MKNGCPTGKKNNNKTAVCFSVSIDNVKIVCITHVQVSSQIQPVTSVISHVTEVILTRSPEAVEGIETPVGGGEFLSKESQLPLRGENTNNSLVRMIFDQSDYVLHYGNSIISSTRQMCQERKLVQKSSQRNYI